MKKLLFTLSFVSCASISTLNNSFEKSLEDEFNEVAQYYYEHKEEIAEFVPNVHSVQDVMDALLSDPNVLIRRHHASNLATFSDLIKKCELHDVQRKQMLEDVQKTFEYLKQKMNIPCEVDIMYLLGEAVQLVPEAGMFYHFFERTVFINPAILNFVTPSYRLFTMIHELVHAQQNMRDGLLKVSLKAKSELLAPQLEREADTNAAEFIKCPLCMKAIYALKLLSESNPQEVENLKKRGYLVSDDFKHSLQHKSLNDLCKAHKSIENPNIWLGLDSQESLVKIIQEDCELVSMFDRLL